jgi:aminopeptidase N
MKNILLVYFVIISFFALAQSQMTNFCCKGKSLALKKPNSVQTFYSDYDIKYTLLNLSVSNTSCYIEGFAMHHALSNLQLTNITFELVDELTVDSVFVNNQLASFSHVNHALIIASPQTVNAGSYFETKIYYHGDPSSNSNYSGISNATSSWWGKQVTWTLSESYHAKEWFPCKEDLNDKIDSVDLVFVANTNCMVGSNGVLVSATPLSGSKTQYHWKSRYPIAYYLISFAVSEYLDYSIYAHPDGYPDSLLIQNYIYTTTGCLNYYKTSINQTVDFIELFSDKFGMYPFVEEKYGHTMAPIPGGMEHQTNTTLGWFDFDLVSHELGHQWFGDNVTCKTWQDIWINEGFATYSQYIAKEYIQSLSTANTWMNTTHNDIMQSPDGSVYVPFAQVADESRIFDFRLSYQKGAAIVHTLRYLIGNDSIFFSLLKNYNTVFKDSTATGDDFKLFAETKTGLALTDFFNQWYYGEGYPTYSVVWNYESNVLKARVLQTGSSSTALFTTPLQIKVNFTGGDTIVKLNISSDDETFYIPMNYQPTTIVLDPNNWIINKVGGIIVGNEAIVADESIRAFPNPVSDWLQIDSESNNIEEIKIVDTQGRVVIVNNCNTKNVKFSMANIEPGLYNIVAKTKNTRIVSKIIKL